MNFCGYEHVNVMDREEEQKVGHNVFAKVLARTIDLTTMPPLPLAAA
jgi:hypothetical protein